MKAKNEWLAFNIKMPNELIPLYDFLQNELNYLLSTKKYRQKLEKIDLSKHKGNVWREMRDIAKPRIDKWTIHNKTWHSYILFENIRRELQSKAENINIYNELSNNNMVIDEILYSNLISKHKIYATRGRIANIKASNHKPELPTSAIFQLDYTISEKQFFRMSEDNLCKIKVSKTDWIDYQIILPNSLNHNLTGKIAKPRFIKRQYDNQYIGICSYEYIPNTPQGNSVLGVDIGQIKLFSAIALNKDGNYGDEYIHSKKLENKRLKLSRLHQEKEILYNKNIQCEILNINTLKSQRRIEHCNNISNKIINLKKDIARNIANEITYIAKKENCNEIHIENLSWLHSQGGKWNHSEIHNCIEQKCKTEGIKCVKVNAKYSSSEHPITKELGKKNNRIVEFENGKKIDRDILASINIATRNKKGKANKLNKLKNKHKVSTRVKISISRKQEIKEKLINLNIKKGNTEIVVFLPQQPKDVKSNGLWSCIEQVQANSSLLNKNWKNNSSCSICHNY